MQVLDQQRLDVANKTRGNDCGWRGHFTPEFVECLAEASDTGTGLVVGTCYGSGTVLEDSASRNRPTHGFKMNPPLAGLDPLAPDLSYGCPPLIQILRELPRTGRADSH